MTCLARFAPSAEIKPQRGEHLCRFRLWPTSALEHWRTQHVLSPCWIVWIVNLGRGFLWQLGGSSELHVFLPFAAISREALSGPRRKPSQPHLTPNV